MLAPLLSVCLLGLSLAAPMGRTVDPTPVYNGMFNRADKDMDGILSTTEVDGIFKGFDLNMDGSATMTEGLAALKATFMFNDANAAAFFMLLDKNNDGALDMEDAKLSYKKFDTNMDDKVNKPEFFAAIHQMFRITPFVSLYMGARSGVSASFAGIKTVLLSLDTNGDKKIQPAELQASLSGPTGLDFAAIAELYVKTLDTDADGALGDADFDAFNKFLDKNNDMVIDKAEIMKVGDLLDMRSKRPF